MSKINSCIYLLCRFPMLNPDEVPRFESFDKPHSSLLYSSLLLNHKEIFDSIPGLANICYCIDHKDRDFIPAEFQNVDSVIWIDTSLKNEAFRVLIDKYFSKFNNNIIVTADSIGMTGEDFKKILNLLSIDDNAVVLGKTFNNKLCSIGFNVLDRSFFTEFNFEDLNYNKALTPVCKQDVHLHTLNSFLVIETLDEFKKLYQELSKKESLAYCSHIMHEKFTALFIEYKGLLK
ncbi:MAG: hypothetical protein R6W90_07960 [Ignavibacteriaceae bacterium]